MFCDETRSPNRSVVSLQFQAEDLHCRGFGDVLCKNSGHRNRAK